MEIVRKMEDCGTTSGEPTKRVQISECGQLPEDDDDGDDDVGDEGQGGVEAKAKADVHLSDVRHGPRRGSKRPRVTFSSGDAPEVPRNGSRGDTRLASGSGASPGIGTGAAPAEETKPGAGSPTVKEKGVG